MTTPGALIAGRYRLHTRVASGGMGSVWEAEDEVLRRRVAVKMLLPQPGMSQADAATARNRVIREARITARLHHPHAVTLYDVVEHAGQPCLIMQFVPSRSLNAILQEHGVLSEQRVAGIGAEVAAALAAAHLAGIVHRDVKPSNVLITDDGSAKLTDFGISHAAGDVNLTSTGMVSGTPAYLAPEVARGAQSGFPADVFSLGATLYAALEGAPPFGTDLNPMAILHRVASGQVIPPRRSGSLTPLLQRMLAPTPAGRPAMVEVARVLAAHAAGPGADFAQRSTASLPPATVRAWPADPPLPTPPPASLSDSLLGTGALRRTGAGGGPPELASPALEQPPLAPPAVVPGRGTRRSRPSSGGGRSAIPPHRRRARLLGGALTVLLLGLVGVGIALLGHRDAASSGVAGSGRTGAPATSTVASASTGSTASSATPRARPTPGHLVPPPSTTPARATTSPPPSSPPPSSATSSAATDSASTSAGPTSRPPGTSTGSTSAHTSGSSAPQTSATDGAGGPTAAQLAAAITDYYAGLPSGTDDGWQHLTPHFQQTTGQNRAYYQRFWDSISTVSVSNARGSAPGTAEATITYRFKDGRESVEDTRYQLVRSDGTLKIDSSEVISSQ